MVYKVLLVDDERIIRDGIARVINWTEHGFSFIGAAKNAMEAYDIILKERPHIVITDIKMPIVNGLELIRKVRQEFEDTVFIVLSGYGEFELASEAMRYGVKYYLLKPCNENEIIDALNNAKKEIAQRERKQHFISKNIKHLNKVLPLVKEQFFRDFVMNRTYTKQDLDYYCSLLNITEEKMQMVIFEVKEFKDLEIIYILLNIIEEIFNKDTIYFKTIVKNQILLLSVYIDEGQLLDLINRTKRDFEDYSDADVTVVYSEVEKFNDIPIAFEELQEYLKYSFYLGTGSVITKRDIESYANMKYDKLLIFDYDRVTIAVKSGNTDEAQTEIENFFGQLNKNKYSFSLVKIYCIELYMAVIRGCNSENTGDYIEKTIELQAIGTIEGMYKFIMDITKLIANENHNSMIKRHNAIVTDIIEYVRDHINDENLSLKWIANNVVYMNEVYLSKLFIEETGEKFSHYLNRIRMERAMKLLKDPKYDKVYEVAEQVGWGKNPQYFSQIFKKHTGYTPTEYKDKFRYSTGIQST